jgi:hypothetical protein
MLFLFGVLFESSRKPERFYVKKRNSHWKSFAPAAIMKYVCNNWNDFLIGLIVKLGAGQSL